MKKVISIFFVWFQTQYLNTNNANDDNSEDFVFNDNYVEHWLTSTPKASPSQEEEKEKKDVKEYLTNVRKRLFISDEEENTCRNHGIVNCDVCRKCMATYEPAQKKIKMNMYVCIIGLSSDIIYDVYPFFV